jgi:hypothetical protein
VGVCGTARFSSHGGSPRHIDWASSVTAMTEREAGM